jgi:8-oxo-dGTP pyrophosphatase MutT (NUDIX family)
LSTPHAGPARWRKGSERVIVSTRVVDLLGVRYSRPDGAREGEFIVLRSPDWVNILALTPDRNLVLVRQFRFGINDFSLEIPGGVIEAGEDPVAAGIRELREETGFEGTGARVIASVHPNPAIQANRCHIILIEGAQRRAETDFDDDEELETSTVPVGRVLEWARAGRITHSLVLSALLHLQGQVPGLASPPN